MLSQSSLCCFVHFLYQKLQFLDADCDFFKPFLGHAFHQQAVFAFDILLHFLKDRLAIVSEFQRYEPFVIRAPFPRQVALLFQFFAEGGDVAVVHIHHLRQTVE